MNIQLLSSHQIDFNKYDDTIDQSQFPTLYAKSWYLDLVTQKSWKILVYDDYKAVVPLPMARLKRNFWMKTVAQPMFCQQLGMFSRQIDNQMYSALMQEILKQRITVYHFNESLQHIFSDLPARPNYILDLNYPYEQLRNQYRKDRKKDIRRGERNQWQVINLTSVADYMQAIDEYAHYMHQTAKTKFKELLGACESRNLLEGKAILNLEGQWMAMAVWIKSYDRRILLSSVRHPELDKKGAFGCLLDAYIVENANQKLVLDFEGSMIPGVADFNASFGAYQTNIPIIK